MLQFLFEKVVELSRTYNNVWIKLEFSFPKLGPCGVFCAGAQAATASRPSDKSATALHVFRSILNPTVPILNSRSLISTIYKRRSHDVRASLRSIGLSCTLLWQLLCVQSTYSLSTERTGSVATAEKFQSEGRYTTTPALQWPRHLRRRLGDGNICQE